MLTGLSPPSTLGSFSPSHHNVRLAVLERVLLTFTDKWHLTIDTRPDPSCVDRLDSYAKQIDNILSAEEGMGPMTFESYASEYPAGKRKLYLEAAESLRNREVRRVDSDIRGFIKFEKDIRNEKPGRIPRVISPPSPRYRLATGVYVRPAEKKLYDAINRVWGHTVVAKGLNYVQVAKAIESHWSSFCRPASLDCDVSKMDKATSWGLQWTNDRLIKCFSGRDKDAIRELLSWQLEYKAQIRGGNSAVKYRMSGSLTSGQVNTSAVGVAQVTACVYSYKQTTRTRLKIINAGDDFTIFGEREDIAAAKENLPAFFKEMGFVLECGEINYLLEGVNFCQTNPVNVEGEWRMVRNPKTVMTKDVCSLYELKSPREIYTHFRGVAKGGLASFGGVPVLQDFYAALLREVEKMEVGLTKNKLRAWRRAANKRQLEDGSLKWFGEGMSEHYRPPSPRTRESFARAFGLEGPFQIGLETICDQWTLELAAIDLRCQKHVNLFR